jgi:hypothetical protein
MNLRAFPHHRPENLRALRCGNPALHTDSPARGLRPQPHPQAKHLMLSDLWSNPQIHSAFLQSKRSLSSVKDR